MSRSPLSDSAFLPSSVSHGAALAPSALAPRALAVSPYDRVAFLYDLLGDAYSWGAIRRAKSAHVTRLASGDRVLYAGAGTGSECVPSAARGAAVTICDLSPRMLHAASKRLAARGLSAQLEQRDALQLCDTYDVVVAPFFLNTFAPEDVGPALRALAAQVRPGGRLISVDFRAPSGAPPFRLLQRAYYLPPQLLFLALARNPWHPLYDYEKIAQSAAPDLTLERRVPERALGLPLFETIYWTKPV